MYRSNGFNLLELLIAVLVIAVLAAAGAPAMRDLVLDARLSAAVNDFVRAVHFARQESQKRSLRVELCPRPAAARCEPDRAWSNGWQVQASAPSGDGPSPVAILRRGQPPAGVHIRANRDRFTFRPFTLRDTNGTVRFCDERGSRSARAVIISPTGRPRLRLAQESNIDMRCHP